MAKVHFGPTEIDMLQWTSRGTLELMGQAGLGYSFDSFEEFYTTEFARALKNLLYARLSHPTHRIWSLNSEYQPVNAENSFHANTQPFLPHDVTKKLPPLPRFPRLASMEVC